MKKVLFFQPLMTGYCIPLFAELGKHWRLIVSFSPADKGLGYGNYTEANVSGVNYCELPIVRPLGSKIGMCQIGVLRLLRRENPDAVIIFANLRYLSFWIILFWCKVRGVRVFPHGHGLYRKRNAGLIWKLVYWVVLGSATKYICYTPSVAASLLELGFSAGKISVADNSLYNPFPVRPNEKSGVERGILFVGRLRSGCKFELLIGAVIELREMGFDGITIHIIGDGPDASHIRKMAADLPWIYFHGEIYDTEQISNISRSCMVGCYPGNAGLSIVHLMSLSLPPITHDNLSAHEGPEPSYILSGINGMLFDSDNPEVSLLTSLQTIIEQPERLKAIQAMAYATYTRLTEPSLAERFIRIVGE